MNKYPCNCEDMRWMVDNNKVFINDGGMWVLSWMEVDRNMGVVNINNFAVKINYCVFCGKKVSNK